MNVLSIAGVAAGGLVFILLAGHRATPPAEIVPGAVETQPFGCTALVLEPVAPACPGGHFHSGIDLAAPAGTPVLAPADGIATVGRQDSCGNFVLIAHGGGTATLYCHLATAAVGRGEAVTAGERIGSVGSSGFSTGPHLHFEVHIGGRPVDPAAWLRQLPATTNDTGGI